MGGSLAPSPLSLLGPTPIPHTKLPPDPDPISLPPDAKLKIARSELGLVSYKAGLLAIGGVDDAGNLLCSVESLDTRVGGLCIYACARVCTRPYMHSCVLKCMACLRWACTWRPQGRMGGVSGHVDEALGGLPLEGPPP